MLMAPRFVTLFTKFYYYNPKIKIQTKKKANIEFVYNKFLIIVMLVVEMEIINKRIIISICASIHTNPIAINYLINCVPVISSSSSSSGSINANGIKVCNQLY